MTLSERSWARIFGYSRLAHGLNQKEQKNEYVFGELIKENGLNLKIKKTDFFKQESSGLIYFFTINSQDALINYIMNNVSVSVLNVEAQTIRIAFKDHNAVKAKDIVDAIDQAYLVQTVEKKSQAQEKTISFLDETLSNTEKNLTESEITKGLVALFTCSVTSTKINRESLAGNVISE